METSLDTLTVNGVTYVRLDQAAEPKPSGERYVLVVDRGWIFAGDLTEVDGKIRLTRAVHVFSWSSVGFEGVLSDPKSKSVNLVKMKHDVVVPLSSEIFRVPVSSDWGL